MQSEVYKVNYRLELIQPCGAPTLVVFEEVELRYEMGLRNGRKFDSNFGPCGHLPIYGDWLNLC